MTYNHIIVWKTNTLPPQAYKELRTWPNKTILVTDEECQLMANRWRCKGFFRKDIMDITRADICRYMAVWKHGGVYTDLDVRLVKSFQPNCDDLCVTLEDNRSNSNIANHFFIGAKNSPCLRQTIATVCENAAKTHFNFRKDPHVIHNVAGPVAFDRAARKCATVKWQFPLFIQHSHASTSWHGSNYEGWVYERKRRAGWSRIYQHRRGR